MADIRIKDLAVTAGSSASDDYLAVDGSTNGTRKLNAYSPTFGGNVVATGTLTVNSTTDSSSKDTGAIITEGGLGVEKSATIGGNLTVSGTGTSSFGGIVALKTPSTTTQLDFQNPSGTTIQSLKYTDSDGSLTIGGSAGVAVPLIFTSQSGTERMRMFANGNFGIGTGSTDGGQKLQVSGEILSSPSGAGYLVFTTHGSKNTGLYYNGSQGLVLYTNTTTALTLDSSQRANFAGGIKISGNHTDFDTSSTFILGRVAGEPILMFSISSAAADERFYDFTATSTQFAMRLVNDAYNAATNFITVDRTGTTVDSVAIGGPLKLNNAYQAGAPTATGYVTIQDSAGNTYKVLVGT